MNKLRDPRVLGALRHVLTSAGPLIAALGWTDDATWQVIVGVVMAGVGFYTSWTAKEKTPS